MARAAVILVGHGAPATDTPAYLVFKLKQLSARRRALGGPPTEEEVEIEERIRTWPRTPGNDPYRAGLQQVAQKMRARLKEKVELGVAFCEFCSPTLEEVVTAQIEEGALHITVVPSMLTPGGVHAEVDVPRMLEVLRGRFPAVPMVYAWPFDLDALAELLVRNVEPHLP